MKKKGKSVDFTQGVEAYATAVSSMKGILVSSILLLFSLILNIQYFLIGTLIANIFFFILSLIKYLKWNKKLTQTLLS